MPALIIGPATCATALATRRHVETTPTTGANGRMAFTSPGVNLLAVIPTAMGARTTYADMALIKIKKIDPVRVSHPPSKSNNMMSLHQKKVTPNVIPPLT